MLTVIRAEVRSSWSAWLGVSLGFLVISYCLALSAMVMQSGILASGHPVPTMEASVYAITGGFNLAMSLLVGLSVVASSTGLVVDSRRGAVARLALAGGTPRTVVLTIATQVALVSLASALVGSLLAIASLRPALDYLQAERGDESAGIPTPAVVDLRVVVGVCAVWVVVAMLAGLKEARRASRIPPVEALREAQGVSSVGRRMGIGRWFRAVLAALTILVLFAVVPVLVAHRDSETFTQIMQMNMLGLAISGWFLAELSPLLVRPLTRAWTALVPSRSPAWFLARATVLSKAERLARSVVPVMFSVGLALGVLGLPATYNATFAASGFDVHLGHAGPKTFLALMGLSLLVAMSGSIGSLFMMARQRDAELALFGIAGATPQQRTSTAGLEAVIITITATLLGVVMVALAYVYIGFGATSLHMNFRVAVPAASTVVAILATGVVTAAATTLPTLRALRDPEPKVVARLVAE